MKDIHVGAHINTCSLVFINPIAKYITTQSSELWHFCTTTNENELAIVES